MLDTIDILDSTKITHQNPKINNLGKQPCNFKAFFTKFININGTTK